VKFEEFGSHALVEDVPYAQINLATVLFGVADASFDATPEMRMPKVTEEAIVSLPPFRITGRIHLLPERELRDALREARSGLADSFEDHHAALVTFLAERFNLSEEKVEEALPAPPAGPPGRFERHRFGPGDGPPGFGPGGP
jgi:hypothetical protein